MSLAKRQQDFIAQTGLPFSYMIILNQDAQGKAPKGATAEAYAAQVKATYPVFADPTDATSKASPWNGSSLPGKCAVAPDMTLLKCWTGHGADTKGYDAIKAHAGL